MICRDRFSDLSIESHYLSHNLQQMNHHQLDSAGIIIEEQR